MRSRRLILCLILLTLVATCLAAAVKLRATPKYDRIQVGMTESQIAEILEEQPLISSHLKVLTSGWFGFEGVIILHWEPKNGTLVVRDKHIEYRSPLRRLIWLAQIAEKHIVRRGPLDRLAWLAGWR